MQTTYRNLFLSKRLRSNLLLFSQIRNYCLPEDKININPTFKKIKQDVDNNKTLVYMKGNPDAPQYGFTNAVVPSNQAPFKKQKLSAIKEEIPKINEKEEEQERLLNLIKDKNNINHYFEMEGMDYKCTPLYIACTGGYIDIVKILLEHPDIDINKGYETPLYIACSRGYIDIVRILLERPDIDINKGKEDDENGTPLYEACSRGYIDIVKILLEHPDIDINKGDYYYDDITALYIACSDGYIDIVKILLKHPNIDINKGRIFLDYTPLYGACSKGYIDIVKILLEHPDIDINKGQDNPLCIACENGKIDIVELLVNDYSDKINVTTSDIKYALKEIQAPEKYKIACILCFGLNMNAEDIIEEQDIKEFNIWKSQQSTKSARK